MADSQIQVTEGSGKNVDTRTNAAGDHRQVIVVGNPTATDSVAEVLAKDPASNDLGLVVRDVNSSAIVAALNTGVTISGDIDRVRNVVDGTLSTVTRVSNVVDGTLSVVTFVPVVQRVQNVVDGTLTTVTGVDRVRNIVDGTISTVGTVTRVDRVMNLVDGTLSTVAAVTGITNSVAVHVLSTGGTIQVQNLTTGTVAMSAKDGTFAVYFSPAVPGVNLAAIGTTNTLGVHLTGTAGTLNVQLKPGAILTQIGATSQIFTVSGTTSTAGNNQLVAPSANYNFKVFAYSLQTTGIVSSAPRFTTGASAGATELWRPLINSVQTASTPVGANLAVAPPGFLFATGVSTTLSLYLDTGTLIHYSVSFIKESA